MTNQPKPAQATSAIAYEELLEEMGKLDPLGFGRELEFSRVTVEGESFVTFNKGQRLLVRLEKHFIPR